MPVVPSEKARIKRSEPIFGIVFYILLFILFNYAPHFIGIISVDGEATRIVPFLNLENIKTFAVIINTVIALGILREFLKIAEGKYTLRFSIFHLILSTASTSLVIIIIRWHGFWNSNFSQEIKDTFGAERLGDFSIENSIVTLSAVFITVAVIIFLAENISNFYKAFRYR